MQRNVLKVILAAPIREVFAFTTNPDNTHKWIPGMKKEEANQIPPRIGTHYRNTSDLQSWDEYCVVEFEENAVFTLADLENNYHVRYSYRETEQGTELIYDEWMEKGELENPFTQKTLDNVKKFF